jgi:hypothetical protein
MHGTIAGEYRAGHTSMTRRIPVGVGSIAPWDDGAWQRSRRPWPAAIPRHQAVRANSADHIKAPQGNADIFLEA